MNTVKSIQKIAWAASSGSLQLIHASNEEIHKAHKNQAEMVRQSDMEDVAVCREALELLTVSLALCPSALDVLNKDKFWQAFIIDLLLLSKSR